MIPTSRAHAPVLRAAGNVAGVAPAPSSYVIVPMSAPPQKSLEQVIAVYDSPTTGRQVLDRISADVAECGTARGRPYVLLPGISTADTIRYGFQPDLSVDMPNRSLDSTEFRLFGSALVAVSSTEPAAVVTAVVDELGKRLA